MIKMFESFNEYNQVKDWLDKMGVENYTINNDLTVDVNGSVFINGNKLKSIEVSFNNVYGSFFCDNNYLTSLKGCPKMVTKHFYCNNNFLTSLEYSPKIISGGGFYCCNNNITTLKGSPESVNGDFDCANNDLTDLLHAPKNILGYIHYRYNGGLPDEIMDITYEFKLALLNNQEEYGVWNSDGSFNKERWNIFRYDFENKII